MQWKKHRGKCWETWVFILVLILISSVTRLRPTVRELFLLREIQLPIFSYVNVEFQIH